MKVLVKHRANLARLAVHLLNLDISRAPGFDMTRYHSRTDFAGRVMATDCGAVACAIGHGPSAGVQPAQPEQTWHEFASSRFGAWRHPSGRLARLTRPPSPRVKNLALVV